MRTFNNKSSLIKLAGFISSDMSAKGTPGSGYSVGTQGWKDQVSPAYSDSTYHKAEGSPNFNSNYNNPSIKNLNRVTYEKTPAVNMTSDILQSQGIPMSDFQFFDLDRLGTTTGDNSKLSVVDTAEMMHKIHPKSYPTVDHARKFRDEYINPGRAQNPDSYLQAVPRQVALFQDPESLIGPATMMGDAPYTYSPESTAFINVPAPNSSDIINKLNKLVQEHKSEITSDKLPGPHVVEAIARDQGVNGRGLDPKNTVLEMFSSDTLSTPHEMHHVGNAVNTTELDKSNNKFFLPKWDGKMYGLAQALRADPTASSGYSFIPTAILSKHGRPQSSYNPRFFDTYLSIPNEHTQTLSQLRHYGKGVGIDTFTKDPNSIRQRYADSFAHLVSNPDPSLNQEDRRLQNYTDSLLYREAERNYLNTPHTAQRPTMLPKYHYALKDPSAIYRQQTIDFNRKNPEQVQKEAQRFLEPWNNNTLLYTY